MIVRAWALALQRVPAANSVWAGDRILRLKNCDIGVGVAVDGGIITPVLRRVEERSLGEIAAEMQLLVGQARARRLAAGDHAAATAISNLGMYGVREFQAIIDPPGSTMLAIGACRPCNVVRNRQSVVADMMTVTLSCDHRVMDGALGAELLSSFRQLVENPFAIVV